jgi:hypothetical protein
MRKYKRFGSERIKRQAEREGFERARAMFEGLFRKIGDRELNGNMAAHFVRNHQTI